MNINTPKIFKNPYLLITLVAGILFIPFLGQVPLFDWDEINFAESAREMLVTGNFSRVQVDYQPFWEKPPLFFWMQALCMKMFGINEFSARLPNAFAGVASLLVLFHTGKKIYDQKFAWLWVLIYTGTFLPHFYFKSGIIDPVFNLFIFIGIYFLSSYTLINNSSSAPAVKKIMLAGLFIGLAILTKGPAGLLLAFLTALVYSLISRTNRFISWKPLGLFILVAGAVSFAWYGLETIKNGIWFIREFILYQAELLKTAGAGHSGPLYYHFIVLLVGCFPASIFMPGGIFNRAETTPHQKYFKKWMVILLLVVLTVFTIVKTKILHYSSLTYFPLTYLAAHFIYHWQKDQLIHWRAYQTVLYVVTGLAISLAFIILPWLAMHPGFLVPYLNDPFAKAALNAHVTWTGWESMTGICYLLVLTAGLIMFLKKRYRFTGVVLVFVSTMLTIQILLITVIPKIERFTQHSAIEFYRGLQNKKVYVEVLGFKSYAHLFYTRKQPTEDPRAYNEQFLLTGNIDRPAYFVTRVQTLPEILSRYPLQITGRKNGYVFLKRTD